MGRERDVHVDAWLNSVDGSELWIPTVVLYEIRGGIHIMADGRRKRKLEQAFTILVTQAFRDRIAVLDTAAATAAALLGAQRQRRGRPAGEIDTLIAGMGVSRNATVATRNVKHFGDLTVPIINPWSI